ncbi:Sec63-domain-containing protein [Cristinia sonorae]|uniref:Sec63-domain-containing protein n=1 Tax=Cristinia sonorae TaxID=1940300 RepID=A0A8K0XTY0_9AGAR|nr:Sec63-domain-containing protein [Cristinia sonorae]
MSNFAAHLTFLTKPQEDSASDREPTLLEDWTRLLSTIDTKGQTGDLDDDVLDIQDDTWDSVVDIYANTSSPDAHSPLLSRILAQPSSSALLEPLNTILCSDRPNEVVSEEVAELLGFDVIELIMDVLNERHNLSRELAEYLKKPEGPQATARVQNDSLDPDAARRRMEETLRANAERPLFSGTVEDLPEVLPHVYTSSSVQGNVLSHTGSKFMLPLGTTRQYAEDYEEVTVPPARAVPPRQTERLIPVSELDELARGSFPGYTSLNRIQSIVYPAAYRSNENMLVCAPTGAGKTDVAMLTILRVLDQYRSGETGVPLAGTIRRDDFKIIYVAPMKALASEIVRKLGKRLERLLIKVRELTGDIQMTKAEIAETQIIVTTPEKWDVVTRKPTGEGELASKVKLLIIDEVHLLNDERGAVIETIVARTLRQVESSQSVIRIVGLSATLPNYIDVSDFLSVNRQTGLFYFDSSFRPVPLEQHFIGIKGKAGSPQSRKNLDKVTYEKVAELVKEGHQVMVFVHARKETVKSAMALKESAMVDAVLEDFSCEDHPQFEWFKKDISTSRNREMKELFSYGFGIHHAGMLRSDRNMMERMFEARAIKASSDLAILSKLTSFLATGSLLYRNACMGSQPTGPCCGIPVIIKGTQVYDSSKGSFTDLSVLDVLQVFGRAGRPGLETSGVGYICTTEDKLTHYLDAVTSQNPIESRFTAGMIDALNAEIALGTVANVHDAVQWVGYTYLYVRMRKNPFQYGMTREQVAEDPHLGAKRTQLVQEAANKLVEARMIAFDRYAGTFTITDLGRIAAKYYIRCASIEIFDKVFRPKMTEADVLAMLCMSTEFDQIQVRENEVKELEQLMEIVPCTVKGGTDTSQGKVNILLQGYISSYRPEDFALVSDQAYAAQNGGRVARALLEIAITRKWANASAVLMGISKAIEKRLWPFDQPLKQFELKQEIFYNLERFADDYTVRELATMSARELGELVHLNERHGAAIQDAAKQFPTVEITSDLRPLGSDVLKIAVKVKRMFNWSSRFHGAVEPFWLWIEDHQSTTILQLSHLVFRQTTTVLDVDFVVSIPNGQPPPSVIVRFVSDRWMGAEDEVPIPLDTLVMPTSVDSHTTRLDIPYLSLSTLKDPLLQDMFGRQANSFNAIQSQIFWSLARTRLHSLICAPAGCGKTLMGQIVTWQTLEGSSASNAWVLVVVPRRSIAMELLADLRQVSKLKGSSVELLTTDSKWTTPPRKTVRIITTSNLCYLLSESKPSTSVLTHLRLVLCENLELLDPAYELGVSSLLHATHHLPTRYVGLSNSLNDPTDLAAWLNVDPTALHSFLPRDRDQALSTSIHTFTIPQSAALFKAMAKPAHTAIRQIPGEQAIVFVPSRGQCRSIGLDLITQCALEIETARGYLSDHVVPEQLDLYLSKLQDISLVDYVNRGVGFFHEGLTKGDRLLVLEMYAEGIINVLLVPHDSCWTLPVRAATVVVMSTQYVQISRDGDERQLRDYDLEELVRMQGRAVRHHGAGGHFHLFCQAEVKDTFNRFLHDGLPLESKLLETEDLQRWYDTQKAQGSIRSNQDAVDALSYTFLARRLRRNPVYYDATTSGSRGEALSRIVDQLNGEA